MLRNIFKYKIVLLLLLLLLLLIIIIKLIKTSFPKKKPLHDFGLNIFYYFNFTIIIQANTYSTRLGIGTEAKCLLSSSP